MGTVINCSLSSWSQLSDKRAKRIWVEERGGDRQGKAVVLFDVQTFAAVSSGALGFSLSPHLQVMKQKLRVTFVRSQANDRF